MWGEPVTEKGRAGLGVVPTEKGRAGLGVVPWKLPGPGPEPPRSWLPWAGAASAGGSVGGGAGPGRRVYADLHHTLRGGTAPSLQVDCICGVRA